MPPIVRYSDFDVPHLQQILYCWKSHRPAQHLRRPDKKHSNNPTEFSEYSMKNAKLSKKPRSINLLQQCA